MKEGPFLVLGNGLIGVFPIIQDLPSRDNSMRGGWLPTWNRGPRTNQTRQHFDLELPEQKQVTPPPRLLFFVVATQVNEYTLLPPDFLVGLSVEWGKGTAGLGDPSTTLDWLDWSLHLPFLLPTVGNISPSGHTQVWVSQ